MRNEKRHTMVRFYLAGTLLLSLLLPSVHLRLAVPQHYIARSEAAASIFSYPGESRISSESRLSSEPGAVDARPTLPLWQWLWLAGVVASAALLTVRLVVLWRRMHGLSFMEHNGMKVALVNDDTPACSFGRRIVVGTRDFSDSEVQQLVGHESVHARQHHTADTMLCELAKVVLWFNPFVYLYARELKRVHEYIADGEMMSADYAALFYHQVSGRQYVPLANQFDYRMVHQRIAMMVRQRNRSGWLKPLAALPIVTVVLMAACTPKSSPIVGQWEYVSGTTGHIYHGDSPYPYLTADMGEEHLLDELDFRADGTATLMAWNSNWENHKMVYQPYAIEWQIVGDSLLLRNERGEEVWHIQQLDDDTLVFVDSDIFTYHGGDGHERRTFTYRRKK